jgi:hypothetical protein
VLQSAFNVLPALCGLLCISTLAVTAVPPRILLERVKDLLSIGTGTVLLIAHGFHPFRRFRTSADFAQ